MKFWARAALFAALIPLMQGCVGTRSSSEEKPGDRAAQAEGSRRDEWEANRSAYYRAKGVPANKASAMAASDFENRKCRPFGGKYEKP